MARTQVVLFSDFGCPFSFVTETALRRLGGGIELAYRAYELFPTPVPLPPVASEASLAPLAPLAAELGLRITPPARAPRTRKAHEAARFARAQGAEAPLRDAIFDACWQRGRDIARIDVLVALAEQLGLDGEELKIALDIDAFADEIAAEREQAERRGVRQTPTLIVGAGASARVVVGAHPIGELRALFPADAGHDD